MVRSFEMTDPITHFRRAAEQHAQLLSDVPVNTYDSVVMALWADNALPRLLFNLYLEMVLREPVVQVFEDKSFKFIYDSPSFKGKPGDDRLVGALAQNYGAPPGLRSRRAGRQYRQMKGMERMDIGHFIAHAVGGLPDINTFPQNRFLNRGWSMEGKKYRQMERYVAAHPGIFFFSRPVYSDESWIPRYLEMGILVPRAWLEKLGHLADEASIGSMMTTGTHPDFRWWLGVFNNECPAPR